MKSPITELKDYAAKVDLMIYMDDPGDIVGKFLLLIDKLPNESPSSSSEEEAIGFAEWLNENRWYNFDNEKKKWCYTFEHGTSLSKGTYEKKYMKTSTELYNEYLKQSTQ